MIKSYKSTSTEKLSEHFGVGEMRCKCGGTHDTKLDTALIEKLEKLRAALNCSKIIVNSGYRCPTHDKNVGGSGSGQHTKGTAADIVCYNGNGGIISAKVVCCAAQDIGFTGIANIDSSYTATHVDVRSGKWFGDETKGTSYNIPEGDFFRHFGLSQKDVYGEARTLKIQSITVDGVTYSGILTEI
ncbi:MAG: D-Ala-D-Ala carboxypeptidase family metallohydrolase [Alistipes sp.]|nr:D-Ala-D-Ala carboxypeptidase family metallohydrolase [Alistipes sp.]